jgi:glyoxylase-like metal-dependent hydrolase (beta-lactamase superfamily II)
MPLTLSGFDPGSVNSYIIQTSGGLTAIDTGWDLPESYASLESQLKEIGAGFSDINQVILTHFHIDHLGFIPRLKEIRSIKIYMHADDLALLKIRYTDVDNFLPMTDRFLQSHGFPAAELTPPEFQLPMPTGIGTIEPDILLHGGEILQVGSYQLKVIHTPGHTPGHVTFYEPRKKFLISGDLLLPTIATNAAFHVQHIEYPLELYLKSLHTLKQLDIDLVLPGHERVFTNARQRIDELLRDHQIKSTVILRSFDSGKPQNAYQISQLLAVSKRTGISRWNQMTGWEKRFAVLQTIAHLKSLEFNHKLEPITLNGLHFFRLAVKSQSHEP